MNMDLNTSHHQKKSQYKSSNSINFKIILELESHIYHQACFLTSKMVFLTNLTDTQQMVAIIITIRSSRFKGDLSYITINVMLPTVAFQIQNYQQRSWHNCKIYIYIQIYILFPKLMKVHICYHIVKF